MQALLILFVALLLIWLATWQRQRQQFALGEAALANGSLRQAATSYETAIRFNTPGSTVMDRSAQRLVEIAERYEAAKEPQQALITYQGLRSALYSIRWLRQPGASWIRLADSRIATLATAGK
jgi:hypothetical protein